MKRTTLAAFAATVLAMGSLAACSSDSTTTETEEIEQSAEAGEGTVCDANVYIVRHGQTEANVAAVVSGWSDSPLTEEGIAQAEAAGAALAGTQFDTALTSDLKRASDTATIVLASAGSDIEPVEVEVLREQNYGGFDGGSDIDMWVPIMEGMGYTFDESKGEPGDFWGNPDALDWYYSVDEEDVMDTLAEVDPAGEAEDWDTYQTRMNEAIATVAQAAEESGCGNVLVVSHGGTIGSMLTLMDPEGYQGESIGNASISHLLYRDGEFTVQEAGVDPEEWGGQPQS